eukprot:g13801.t1
MEAVHETGYPAIARAHQLSAERLGVPQGSARASRWDISRPLQPCDGDTETWGSRHRRQQVTVEIGAAAMHSSLSPPAPATARRGAGGGDVRRDKSTSPLPPRHGRPAQRPTPTVLVDITQILRGVREEAAALDRFLSLEVEPAARHIFEEAVSEHARAHRLFAGLPPPPPPADFAVDPASSNSSTPTTASNSTKDDDEDTRSFAAPAAARRRQPDAGRRVLKPPVTKHHPPPEFNLRASSPVRAGSAGVAVVGRGAGAGAGSDKSRLSLPGRHCRYPRSETVGKPGKNKQRGGAAAGAGVEREAVVVAMADEDGRNNGRTGDGERRGGRADAAAGSGKICVDKADEVEEGEGEGDEREWKVLRLPDGQKKLANDISSKMVGLSSLIRNKAAAASGGAGRSDHQGRA